MGYYPLTQIDIFIVDRDDATDQNVRSQLLAGDARGEIGGPPWFNLVFPYVEVKLAL